MSKFVIKTIGTSGYTHIMAADAVDVEEYYGSKPNIRTYENGKFVANYPVEDDWEVFIENMAGKTVKVVRGQFYTADAGPVMAIPQNVKQDVNLLDAINKLQAGK